MSAKTIGRYEIIAELGQGGMAVVALARDPCLGRQVAIKRLPYQLTFDPQFRTRFLREAEATATFEHPAIVPIYDYGEVDDRPFIVMRYMPGGSLADRMAQGSLRLAEISLIFNRLAEALDAAHQRGMVHRDLKPSNILFDQWRKAYLSDFGIVKLAEATAGLTGTNFVGTPAYTSPEQASGKGPLDGRSDLYSLAVILFQLLAHQLPFKADTPVGLALAHLVEPVPNILDFNASLSPAFDGLIRKALAKDPNDRYPTTSAFAAALAALAANRPMRPAPLTVRTSLRRPPPNLDDSLKQSGTGRQGPVPGSGETPPVPSALIQHPEGASSSPEGIRNFKSLALTSAAIIIALLLLPGLCLGSVVATHQRFALPASSDVQRIVSTPTQIAVRSFTPTSPPGLVSSALTASVTPLAPGTPTPTQTGRGAACCAPTPTPTPTRRFFLTTPLPPSPSATPSCAPPEFFDPFLNRCRMPDSPGPSASPPGSDASGGKPTQEIKFTATPCVKCE